MKEIPVNNITVIFEQAATNNENIAKLIASFYGNLKTEGMPDGLASNLVMMFFDHLMASSHASGSPAE